MIAILQCGVPPAGLEAHGSYATMLQRLLGPAHAAEVFDVQHAPPPPPGAHAGYLLSGSSSGVYEPDAWIARLLEWIRAARGTAPMAGICFGHQAMAQALGGQVTKSGKGWGIGLHRYDVMHRTPWMDEAAQIALPASHQDQVVRPPPGAATTLASPFCPHAGLDYGDAASIQAHPEFSPAFGIALIEQRLDRYGPAAEPAIASYAAPNDCQRVAAWLQRFFASPLPSRQGTGEWGPHTRPPAVEDLDQTRATS